MDQENTITSSPTGRSTYARKISFLFFLCTAILMWVGIIHFGSSQYVDEKVHVRQINRFLKGNYDLLPNLTTVPGYHLVVASISRIFHKPSSGQFRAISLSLSCISIGFFYLLAKRLHSEYPLEKTLQYIFIPIIFFYFPLVYTDIFSLLMVLVAFYFLLSRRYSWSAFFSLAAIAVRQNNILWVAFIWIYGYIEKNGFSFSKEKIYEYFYETLGYAVVSVSFVIFFFINKGVAIGDQESHQVGLYVGNLYFFLALIGFLFVPVLFFYLRKIKSIDAKRLYLGLGFGTISALAFLFFSPAIHEGNLKMHFLRNIILQFAYNRYVLVYALAVMFGCLALFLMKFEKKDLLIFPFIAIFLSQSFLIEQRYAIIPIVFLLLFRKELNYKIEYCLIIYFFLLSTSLLLMLFKSEIFF